MNLRQQSQQLLQRDELQREFDIQEFLAVTQHLLNALSLNFNFNIKELYSQIRQQNGRVIGRDILKLFHILKEQNAVQRQIDDQIQFYRTKISQIVSKGKSFLTIGQFFVYFILNNPKKGIVSDEIQDNISQYKVISMQKLLGLIQYIQRTRNQNKKLKSDASIFLLQAQRESDEYIYRDQFYQIQQLRTIILQNCVDQSKNSHSITLLQKIKKRLIQNLQYIERCQQSQKLISTKQLKISEQFGRLQQIINQKQDQINQLYQKNEGYENQIQIFQQKCREDFIDTITKLGQDNKKLLLQRNQAIRYYQQMTKQLQWFKINYHDVFNKYKEHVQRQVIQVEKQVQVENVTKIQVFQVQAKVRLDYILENQSKENYESLNRLRIQNLELKHRISDLQAQLQSRAMTSGHQTDRTFQNITLDDRVYSTMIPHHQQAKQTFLQLLRRKSYVGQIEGQLNKTLLQQRSNSIRLIRTVTNQFFRTATYKQQQNQINEIKQQIKIQTKIQAPCELNQKLYQFDLLGVLNSQNFQQITNYPKDFQQVAPCKKIFSSYVNLLQASTCKRQKLALIMSSKNLLFYTPKNKQNNFSIKTTNIQSIYFCKYIRDLIVIKTKQKILNLNNSLIDQLILSLNNRGQLLKYLQKVCFLDKQSNFKIIFEQEHKIEIKQNQLNINFSQLLRMNTLVENSINDGQNVFQAKIHYLIVIFDMTFRSIIVINPIGILVFQAGKNYAFQKSEQKQKLKFILPFCKNMEIIDLSQQNKLKLVYPAIKKSYVIQLESYGETKLVKQKIKKKMYNNNQYDKKQHDQYLQNFIRLGKMRSVQQQQSL